MQRRGRSRTSTSAPPVFRPADTRWRCLISMQETHGNSVGTADQSVSPRTKHVDRMLIGGNNAHLLRASDNARKISDLIVSAGNSVNTSPSSDRHLDYLRTRFHADFKKIISINYLASSALHHPTFHQTHFRLPSISKWQLLINSSTILSLPSLIAR